MTPVRFDDILEGWMNGTHTSDLYCLPKPPYRPMIITWMSEDHLDLAEFPPANTLRNPPRRLTKAAFDVAGYVRYREDAS